MADKLNAALKAAYVAGCVDMRDRLKHATECDMVLAMSRFDRKLGDGLYAAQPFYWNERLQAC